VSGATITPEVREGGGGVPRPYPGGPLLTAEQVGELLGVPKSWVYEQSRKGRIPTVTLGRYRRYRAEAIEHWVEQLENEGVGF
jgi:excisionase family DNA binding protein